MSEKTVVSGKVQSLVPSDFALMPPEMIKAKYPTKNPKTVEAYSNETGSVNLAFEHTQNRGTQEQLPQFKGVFEKQFASIRGLNLKRSELKAINGRDFVVMEFISPAIDTQIYNLMFVTSVEGRMLICTFNCTEELLGDWQTTAYQILESVKVN